MPYQRYQATTLHGDPCVVDTQPRIRMVVARCGLWEDAELVAAALNAHTPEPEQIEDIDEALGLT